MNFIHQWYLKYNNQVNPVQEVSWALVWSLVYNLGVKINCSWCYRWEVKLTGERWRILGSWWRSCWRCVCRRSLWRRRPWTLSWVRLTDWSRNSSCQQHWALRSTCEFQDQEIQINSCAAADRKWSEPFHSEGCDDETVIRFFFYTGFFFPLCDYLVLSRQSKRDYPNAGSLRVCE